MSNRTQPEAPAISVAAGARLRALREARRLSIKAVEAATGIPRGTISKAERGVGNASAGMLDALARHLGADLLDLLISPSPDRPRHVLFEETRDLPPGDLRDLLDLARRLAARSAPKVLPFREVPTPARVPRVPSEVPLLGYDVAAGDFDFSRVYRDITYVRPNTRRTLRPGCFVARVVGHSMEPKIPNGAYALFASDAAADSGDIVLARLGNHIDEDTSASYTLKRLRRAADRATLEPLNPAYRPIEIGPERIDELRIIACFVEVLAPDPSA